MIAESAEDRPRRILKIWVPLAIIILFVVLVRVRLMGFPLERDEGEYAYMGQLILQGIPPYSEAYNMKFPGTYFMYAIIMFLFGQNIQGVHLGFMVINCVTVILIFFLAKRFISESAALAASAAYAVLSLSSSVLGFAAHATHFVALPALCGVLALLHALRNDTFHAYFWSGFLFGLAFLMKQSGIFFPLFGFSYIAYAHFHPVPARSIKKLIANLGMFTMGGAAPLILTAAYLYAVGAFDKFWFWTFEYASKYGSQIPVSAAFDIFKENFSGVAGGFTFLWIMAAAGIIVMFFYRKLKDKRFFIAMFILFSFLTVCPGFYFRPHYFVTMLPAISILTGIFVQWLDDRAAALFKARHAGFIGIAVFILAAGAGMVSQKEYLFEEETDRLSRSIYGVNPFPESIEIAKFIESQSAATDRVAVFGSEPQIYFYSRRHSATGHIYMYGLMEIHDYSLAMQEEMIREVASADPKFIVVVPIDTSWLIRPESEKYILRWLEEYLRSHYTLVGVADIVSDERTVYKWYSDAQGYTIQSPYHVLIFEKTGK